MNLGMLARPLLLSIVLVASSFATQANAVVVDRSGVVPYVIDGHNVVARGECLEPHRRVQVTIRPRAIDLRHYGNDPAFARGFWRLEQ